MQGQLAALKETQAVAEVGRPCRLSPHRRRPCLWAAVSSPFTVFALAGSGQQCTPHCSCSPPSLTLGRGRGQGVLWGRPSALHPTVCGRCYLSCGSRGRSGEDAREETGRWAPGCQSFCLAPLSSMLPGAQAQPCADGSLARTRGQYLAGLMWVTSPSSCHCRPSQHTCRSCCRDSAHRDPCWRSLGGGLGHQSLWQWL